LTTDVDLHRIINSELVLRIKISGNFVTIQKTRKIKGKEYFFLKKKTPENEKQIGPKNRGVLFFLYFQKHPIKN
jgi:hypothetical protein